MNEERKKQIDEMEHEEMLRTWQSAPAGSPWFQGEVGKYYSKVSAMLLMLPRVNRLDGRGRSS